MKILTATHPAYCESCESMNVFPGEKMVVTEDGAICWGCAISANLICNCDGLKDPAVDFCKECEQAIEDDRHESRLTDIWCQQNL